MTRELCEHGVLVPNYCDKCEQLAIEKRRKSVDIESFKSRLGPSLSDELAAASLKPFQPKPGKVRVLPSHETVEKLKREIKRLKKILKDVNNCETCKHENEPECTGCNGGNWTSKERV